MLDPTSKVGARCAIAGALLLVLGTYLHPISTHPNDALAAFSGLAEDRTWMAAHLMELAGIALTTAALLLLARRLEMEGVTIWPPLATAGAIVSLMMASALVAVDGVALKAMVIEWATASAAHKESAFQAAFAVRQIEVGLAAAFSLILGATVALYGMALFEVASYPKWIGALAIFGGAITGLAGIVMAYTGFSLATIALNMPASIVLLAWMFALGTTMWLSAGTSDEAVSICNSKSRTEFLWASKQLR